MLRSEFNPSRYSNKFLSIHYDFQPKAVVATAHLIGRVVYRMLKYKVEYEAISVNEYEKKYEEQQIKYMRKKAAKFGFQLIPA